MCPLRRGMLSVTGQFIFQQSILHTYPVPRVSTTFKGKNFLDSKYYKNDRWIRFARHTLGQRSESPSHNQAASDCTLRPNGKSDFHIVEPGEIDSAPSDHAPAVDMGTPVTIDDEIDDILPSRTTPPPMPEVLDSAPNECTTSEIDISPSPTLVERKQTPQPAPLPTFEVQSQPSDVVVASPLVCHAVNPRRDEEPPSHIHASQDRLTMNPVTETQKSAIEAAALTKSPESRPRTQKRKPEGAADQLSTSLPVANDTQQHANNEGEPKGKKRRKLAVPEAPSVSSGNLRKSSRKLAPP